MSSFPVSPPAGSVKPRFNARAVAGVEPLQEAPFVPRNAHAWMAVGDFLWSQWLESFGLSRVDGSRFQPMPEKPAGGTRLRGGFAGFLGVSS